MPRSPLTETIYRVQGMISYVRENLSTDEFMLFLDLLVPEPEPETARTTKKKRKPRVGSKSPRATSLAEQIKGMGKPRSSDSREPICATCGNVEEFVDHSQPSPHYHEFQPPQSKVAAGA